jgi:hypothetical protein
MSNAASKQAESALALRDDHGDDHTDGDVLRDDHGDDDTDGDLL